jgi:hypothetical protein
MPKFHVEVCSTVYEWRTVEVEAETAATAGERAVGRICDETLPEIPIDKSESGEHDVIDCTEL